MLDFLIYLIVCVLLFALACGALKYICTAFFSDVAAVRWIAGAFLLITILIFLGSFATGNPPGYNFIHHHN